MDENKNNDTKMKIKRKVKSDNFTILDNLILRRHDMTARSKGVFAHILSLPDNWIVYKKELFRHHKEGYDALNTAFNELKDLGYINHYSVRDKKGRIKRWDCDIFEDPSDNPSFKKKKITNNPYLEYPDQENPNQVKQELDYPEKDYLKSGKSDLLSTYSTKDLQYKELNKLIEDEDDLNSEIKNIITPKIISNLKNAGINNLTSTKLRPLAISMSKLMNLHNKKHNEAAEVILLAIEFFELNNGQSINYIIALLEDWEEKELYSPEEIRKYRRDYKKGYAKEIENEIEPVPMINWLKDLEYQKLEGEN